MKKIGLLFVALSVILPGMGWAADYVPGELLLGLKEGVEISRSESGAIITGQFDLDRLNAQYGAYAVDFNSELGLYRLKVSAKTDIMAAVAAYRAVSSVRRAEPNLIATAAHRHADRALKQGALKINQVAGAVAAGMAQPAVFFDKAGDRNSLIVPVASCTPGVDPGCAKPKPACTPGVDAGCGTTPSKPKPSCTPGVDAGCDCTPGVDVDCPAKPTPPPPPPPRPAPVVTPEAPSSNWWNELDLRNVEVWDRSDLGSDSFDENNNRYVTRWYPWHQKFQVGRVYKKCYYRGHYDLSWNSTWKRWEIDRLVGYNAACAVDGDVPPPAGYYPRPSHDPSYWPDPNNAPRYDSSASGDWNLCGYGCEKTTYSEWAYGNNWWTSDSGSFNRGGKATGYNQAKSYAFSLSSKENKTRTRNVWRRYWQYFATQCSSDPVWSDYCQWGVKLGDFRVGDDSEDMPTGKAQNVNVKVEFVNDKELLPWEEESFSVYFNGQQLSVGQHKAAYNYQEDISFNSAGGQGVIKLEPGVRILKAPDASGVKVRLVKDGWKLSVEFEDKWASYYPYTKLELDVTCYKKNEGGWGSSDGKVDFKPKLEWDHKYALPKDQVIKGPFKVGDRRCNPKKNITTDCETWGIPAQSGKYYIGEFSFKRAPIGAQEPVSTSDWVTGEVPKDSAGKNELIAH